MNVLSKATAVLTTLTLSWSIQIRRADIPRMPQGELLVEGYAPDRFLLTTAERTFTLREDVDSFGPSPSISADGSMVASTHRVPADTPHDPARVIAATYSVKEQKWTDHPELEGVKWMAMSPDGSKLGCVTRDKELSVLDTPHYRFRILDLQTGKMTMVMESSALPMSPSWSPDGRHLVFDMLPPEAPEDSRINAIYIANLEDNTFSRIGVGQSPSWSPSGEWVAFVGYVQGSGWHGAANLYDGRSYETEAFQIRLTSTAGTHTRAVNGFSGARPTDKPVWSPDSKALLINKMRDPDNGTYDIYLSDIASGKTTKIFKNVGPVYGWVETR